MKYTLLLLSLLVVSVLSAQEYGITISNDTIYGKVIISTYSGNHHQVLFKNNKSKKRIKVYELKSVHTKKDILHTKKIRGKYQLAKLEHEGYLSLYKFSESNTPSPIFNTPIMIKKTGEQMEVSNIGFKKNTREFLSDCENVVQNFNDNKYRSNRLEEIITDYNACIDNRTLALQQKDKQFAKRVNKVNVILRVKDSVRTSTDIAEKSEVLDILGDISSKLEKGEKIPGYLIDIIHQHLANEPELKKQLMEIL